MKSDTLHLILCSTGRWKVLQFQTVTWEENNNTSAFQVFSEDESLEVWTQSLLLGLSPSYFQLGTHHIYIRATYVYTYV